MGNKIDCHIRIKQAMELRNMNQTDIVEKTNIKKSALSQYISGKINPRQNAIEELSKVLNVSEPWLMGYDVPMERCTIKRKSENSDFILSNGAEYEIKITKGKITICEKNEQFLKKINLDDEKNFKLKNALRLLETITEDVKLDSESTAILAKLIERIIINNYHVEKYNKEIKEIKEVKKIKLPRPSRLTTDYRAVKSTNLPKQFRFKLDRFTKNRMPKKDYLRKRNAIIAPEPSMVLHTKNEKK